MRAEVVTKEEVANKGTTFPVVPGSNPAENDDFEKKVTAAMALAEKGGGLSGLSGGMQNSPPGSRPVFAAAANSPDCLPIDDAEPPSESCSMDHDGEATPGFARAKTHGREGQAALSPVSVSASPPERRNRRGAKPVPKNTKAETPTAVRTETREEDKETDNEDDTNGTTPPGVDFERMLAKAMAAANGAKATDVDKVLGAQNSSKMMNSPAPVRRQTPARAAKKTPESSKSGEKTPTSSRATRSRERPSANPEWVSNSDSVDLARSCSDTSVENESTDDTSLTESPVIHAPDAPPPPPTAWLQKAAAAKAPPLPKPEWVSSKTHPAVVEPAENVSSPHQITQTAVPLAVPPLAASAVLAALAAGQRKKREASEAPDGAFDFEAKLLAAMRAETLGGAAAFGGTSARVCNSPEGNSTGLVPPKLSLKEEARRQGVTVAQLAHARAHAESPLAKVRF